MEQALGWERPAYFIEDRTAPVRRYDWYGSYGNIPNEDKRYEKELEGDLTFDFSKHHDLVKITFPPNCIYLLRNIFLVD